jgi:integrase
MAGSATRQGTTWQYVVDLGLDGNGRRRQFRRRGFPTKTAAQQAMLEAQSLQLRGELANPGRRTLENYLTQWLDAVQASLEPAAWTNYRNCLRLYVLPRLGHVQLGLLTPLTLSSMYAELLRSGGRKGRPLSPTSARLVRGVVRKALNDAVQWGLLGTNPALRASVPKRRRVQLRVWSPEEAAVFVAAVGNDRLAACWLLALTAGLRRGELAGLRWEDLDLDRAALRVAVQRTTDSDYNVVSKEPKASSRRGIALAEQMVLVLRRHRVRQAQERLAAGPAWHDTGLVFVDELGRGYHPQRITDLFQEASAAAGLPRIRLHDLRHTSATLALVAGVHPKIVQERLGHASIGMTLDIYSHVLAGMQHDAAAQVERLLWTSAAEATPALPAAASDDPLF